MIRRGFLSFDGFYHGPGAQWRSFQYPAVFCATCVAVMSMPAAGFSGNRCKSETLDPKSYHPKSYIPHMGVSQERLVTLVVQVSQF